MSPPSVRPWAACAASSALLLVFVAPATALQDDPVSVPPPVIDEAPGDARYVEPAFEHVVTAEDVAFGQAVNSRDELETLLLDVYEPADDPTEPFRPAIVWAHGGYMRRGTKGDVQFLPHLVERGYVGVSITYRVRPELPHGFEEVLISPDVVDNTQDFAAAVRDAHHDMLAAVRWLRANAAELRIDPNQIIVAGHSAGALVAFNAVFNHEDEGSSGSPGWPSHVAAALPSAGGYGPGVTGRPPQPGDAPVLVTHGTHDLVVPMAASTLPCATTIAVGNVCEQRLYPGAGHGLPSDDRAGSSADFLWRHVLTAERIQSSFGDVDTQVRGEIVTVTGQLTGEDPRPLIGGEQALADARVLARSRTGDWTEAVTDDEGRFSLDVAAPDHGRTTEIELRYEGRSTGSWLDEPHTAPTHTTTIATWGAHAPGN